ncbi:hypothetical protein F5X99DRAFT_431577 [Biscogniauxia marginata]|nr:hypothetical protein F5X99DRAFT_431577 [Biscogniauxia marginata]
MSKSAIEIWIDEVSSSSLVKNTANFRFANSELRPLAHSYSQLPPSTRALVDHLRDAFDGIQILPTVVRNDANERVHPHNLIQDPAYHLGAEEALAELRQVRSVADAASDCQLECQSEAAWNARVHNPLLLLALAGKRGKTVKPWITTTATMISESKTRSIDTGEIMSSKMVDFCLTIELRSPKAVQQVLMRQPCDNLRTINQTMYPPLRFRPIAVAIETKIETSASMGESQLGIWTKGWLNRMGLFGVPECPPVPLIHIRGHEWYVLLGWTGAEYQQQEPDPGGFDTSEEAPTGMRESKLLITMEQAIGDTRSLLGIYKLLRSIRLLADWAEADFREWFENIMIPAAQDKWVFQ